MRVKGDAFSLQPNNFEMRMRLCVLRCCICFSDDILDVVVMNLEFSSLQINFEVELQAAESRDARERMKRT